jgi:hypothetical protein
LLLVKLREADKHGNEVVVRRNTLTTTPAYAKHEGSCLCAPTLCRPAATREHFSESPLEEHSYGVDMSVDTLWKAVLLLRQRFQSHSIGQIISTSCRNRSPNKQDKAEAKAEKLGYKELIKEDEVEAAKMKKLKEEASAAEGGLDSTVARWHDPSTDSESLPAAKTVEETRVGAGGSPGSRVIVASDGRATSGRRKGQCDNLREPARSVRFEQEPATREFELVMPGPAEM